MSKRHLKPIRATTRFCDLDAWDDLYGYCYKCGQKTRLDRDALERQYGSHVRINSLTTKLRCTVWSCKNKEHNMIGTRNKIRD